MSNARSLASFLSGTPTADFNFDSNSLVVDISENTVGIGDTTPDGKLEVRQTASADILNLYDDTTNVLTVVDGGNVGIGDDSPDGKLEVRQSGTDDIFNLYDDTTNVLTVVDGGKVGIGTSTPDGLVDIRQSGTDDILNLYDGTDNIFTVVDGGKVGIKSSTPDGMLDVRSLTADDIFNLYDGSTNVFTVIDGGKVGIGEPVPISPVHINVDATDAIPTNAMAQNGDDNVLVLRNSNNSSNYSGLKLETRTSGAAAWLIANEWKNTYLGDLVFRYRNAGSTSAEAMRIDNSGSVRVGAASYDINGTAFTPHFSVTGSQSTSGGMAYKQFYVAFANSNSAYDTGIPVNTGGPGAGGLIFAKGNLGAGANSSAGLFILKLYMDGDHTPQITNIGGDSFGGMVAGKTGSSPNETLTVKITTQHNIHYNFLVFEY
tara:strand:+ start:152 stop:1444 length:1293 start_codon:yes stop_codon:yes gene_type:complete